MTRITWSDESTGETFVEAISVTGAARLTPDGGDVRETVAAQVVKHRVVTENRWPDREEVTIRVIEPEGLAGSYAASISRSAGSRKGGDFRHLGPGEEGATGFGTSARRFEPTTRYERDAAFAAAERLVSPDQVEDAYDILGNVYGHEITGVPGEEDAIDALTRAYDDAVLHDRGWPARSKIRGTAGFLAHADLEGPFDPEAAREFAATTGSTMHEVTKWAGEEASFAAAFLPADRLDEARDFIHLLAQAASPNRAPGNR